MQRARVEPRKRTEGDDALRLRVRHDGLVLQQSCRARREGLAHIDGWVSPAGVSERGVVEMRCPWVVLGALRARLA